MLVAERSSWNEVKTNMRLMSSDFNSNVNVFVILVMARTENSPYAIDKNHLKLKSRANMSKVRNSRR